MDHLQHYYEVDPLRWRPRRRRRRQRRRPGHGPGRGPRRRRYGGRDIRDVVGGNPVIPLAAVESEGSVGEGMGPSSPLEVSPQWPLPSGSPLEVAPQWPLPYGSPLEVSPQWPTPRCGIPFFPPAQPEAGAGPQQGIELSTNLLTLFKCLFSIVS